MEHNLPKSMLLLMRNKSVRNIVIEIGPKMDPFGAPIFFLSNAEPILVFLFSFVEKNKYQSYQYFSFTFIISKVQSIQSNASNKYVKTAANKSLFTLIF